MKRIRSSFSVIENFLDIMTSHDQEEWLPKYKASVTGGKGSQVSLGQLFTNIVTGIGLCVAGQ